LEISTPGRICLFGEHQDYLGLPIIAMAISLRSYIKGEKVANQQVTIHKPDLNDSESFSLDNLDYDYQRDYYKSGIKICLNEGLSFSHGFNCEVSSKIPFQAGTSSSSAIMVSWVHFLSRMADEPVDWDLNKIAEVSYKAETLEFEEPGGMMDQYTTSIGDFIYLESNPGIVVDKINPKLGTFVLGDSLQPKDTIGILSRCKDSRLEIIKKLEFRNPGIDFQSCNANHDLTNLDEDEKELYFGTIRNKEILNQAIVELKKDKIDHKMIGRLLNDHQSVLRDILCISTDKVDDMINAALNAGAYGGKINGSGGGGCMFAYAPENPERVAEAIEDAGGKSYIICSDQGTRVEE
jgi:galactokinase